jgi:hypothetical protein
MRWQGYEVRWLVRNRSRSIRDREPELSVIVITPDSCHTIARAVACLGAQSVADRLEVVIVAPSAEELEADDLQLAPFHSVQVVAVGEVWSVGEANAAGVRRARAPAVALVEEHSYPQPGWAEALIEAHLQPWAAVGPVVWNANGDSLVAWADFLIAYGPWMDPSHSGIRDFLPGHNSSYKRTLLLGYGPDLEGMLESEASLHLDLQAKGHQLYLEPAARITHLNFERLPVWTRAQYYAGRAFAAARSVHWPLPRRLLYALAGPLIPLVRLNRILGQLRGTGRPPLPFPAVLPALLCGLAISAAGESAGYALGAGVAVQRLRDLEFHRDTHLNPGPRAWSPVRGQQSTE